MAKLVDKKNKATIQKSKWVQEILNYYVIAILCVFPVIYTDKYFNILATKYNTYWISTLIMALLIILGALLSIVICKMIGEKNDIMYYLENFSIGKFLKSFSVAEIALVIFLITGIISTIQSDNPSAAWSGDMGRHTGLFLLLVYGTAYFIMNRHFKLSGWHINVFLVIGLFVALFGITDYFKMDLLKFKVNMDENQKAIFTSTIGNINTYTAYIGMFMAVASILFCKVKKGEWIRFIFYYVCMAVSIMALILGQSDNAYLSFMAFCGLAPFYLFWHKEGIRRYIIFLATFFSITEIINLINIYCADKVLELYSAFNLIIEIKWLPLIIAALWIIVAVWYVLDHSESDTDDKTPVPVAVWAGICVVFIAIMAKAVYDCNVLGDSARYGGLQPYLIFNEEWGSHRGFIWNKAMIIYRNFSPLRKLVGFGPDTFIIMMEPFKEESVARYGERFDSVHNEYLQYLVTMGALGFISYIVFLIASLVKGIKKAGSNPYVMACVFAVICYAAQATVSINLPIATPIMWTLLMMI